MPDEIKKEDVVVVDEIDWEAKAKKLEEDIAKIAAERENYKKVALSKKGKSDEDEENPDEKMRRIAREELLATKEGQLIKEKDELLNSAAKKINELTVALKARGQVGASASTGGGQSTIEVKTEFWTPEQMAYFKRHNIDPEKVKDNYLKIKQS